ncbi:MAG: hypothetical protein VX498_10325 [Myxococcota bacterium]|nr:hypothetical protein [Myxococcota bacterium]
MTSSRRWKQTVSLALVLLALGGCDPGQGGDCVIEETGYLGPCVVDPDLVAWTVFESQVQSVGLPGAVPPVSPLQLENRTTGVTAEADSSETGSFILPVGGSLGDEIALSIVDLPSAGEAIWEVDSLSPFPETLGILARPAGDTDTPTVVVEVEFSSPQIDGRVRVANPMNDHVAYLDAFQGGALHGGHLVGSSGDLLLLFWLAAGDEASTEALEVEVAD